MIRWLRLLLFVFGPLAAVAGEFDAMLLFPGAWRLTAADVTGRFPKHFKALDAGTLRFSAEAGNSLKWCGYPLCEALLRFDGSGKLKGAELIFFSRGDAKEPLAVREFEKTCEQIRAAMGTLLPGCPAENQSILLAGAKIRGCFWRGRSHDQLLRSSISGRRQPEFLIAEFYRPGAAPKTLREGMRTAGQGTAGTGTGVRSNEKGDRFLEIPMVDQGGKGYCVAASVERIMRYYGSQLDQHTFAQIAGSDAEAGTDIRRAVGALKKIDGRLGVRYHSLYEERFMSQEREFSRFVKEYNQLARRRRIPLLRKDRPGADQPVDREIFAQVRMRDKNGFRRFVADVRASIDAGIPVCWCVLMFPAPGGPEQKISGHCRIICGYNAKLDTLIYTDSWGEEHGPCGIAAADAWAITMRAFQLLPRKPNDRGN